MNSFFAWPMPRAEARAQAEANASTVVQPQNVNGMVAGAPSTRTEPAAPPN